MISYKSNIYILVRESRSADTRIVLREITSRFLKITLLYFLILNHYKIRRLIPNKINFEISLLILYIKLNISVKFVFINSLNNKRNCLNKFSKDGNTALMEI